MADGRELIDRLCTAAGMIMEDVVEQAMVSGPEKAPAGRVATIERAGSNIAILADAAAVILRRWRRDDQLR